VCRLAFLFDSEAIDPVDLRMLRRLGTKIDLAGVEPERWASALRPHAVDGFVAFSDDQMVEFAEMAAELGLDYHAPKVAHRLRDKSLQREAMQAAGIEQPPRTVVDQDIDAAAISRLAGSFPFPAVLKPRSGANSRSTFAVPDASALVELLDSWRADPDRDPMVLEGYLAGTEGLLGAGFADYLSVESVVQDGEVEHFASTARLPLAPPFRETGFCIPSAVEGKLLAAIEDVAARAIRSLGIRRSCVHTEIKMTPDGPRVIEVNGRLGGGIPAMLELATGVSAVRIALRVALGERVGLAEFGTRAGVGYRFLIQPPVGARWVEHIEGLDKLGRVPGVDAVAIHRGPGAAVDSRVGNHDYVVGVTGVAPDHAGVLETHRKMLECVQVVYKQ
jgi:biotin carboxylase